MEQPFEYRGDCAITGIKLFGYAYKDPDGTQYIVDSDREFNEVTNLQRCIGYDQNKEPLYVGDWAKYLSTEGIIYPDRYEAYDNQEINCFFIGNIALTFDGNNICKYCFKIEK